MRKVTVADAFPGGVGRVPNNPALAAVVSSVWKGGPDTSSLVGGWGAGPTGKPVYTFPTGKGGRVTVYPVDRRPPNSRGDVLDHLWSIVHSLTPFTADVFLAILAQLACSTGGTDPARSMGVPVEVTADTILKYKGLKRYGYEAADLRERVKASVNALAALQFDGDGIHVAIDAVTGKKLKQGATFKGDRFFDIVLVESSDDGSSRTSDLIWSVRAGQWAHYWLNAKTFVWLANMAKALLELDHRDNRPVEVIAKKLGQRLTLLQAACRDPLKPLQIEKLLIDIGEMPTEDRRIDKYRNWASRLRSAFEKAIEKLIELGVIESATNLEGASPGDDGHRAKGWVQPWLASRVHVVLAGRRRTGASEPVVAPVTHQTEDRRPSKRRGTKEKDPALLGARLRQARNDRHVHQAVLAEKLGISPGWLSQIEQGKRVASPELTQRLQRWLDSSDAPASPGLGGKVRPPEVVSKPSGTSEQTLRKS